MAAAALSPVAPPPASAARALSPPLIADVWHAPLVPAALALTAGIVLDRHASIPLGASLLVIAASLAAWTACRVGGKIGLARVYLALAVAAFGAGYAHWRREIYRPDDIGQHASDQPRPIRLRGVLDEEPIVVYPPPPTPLRSVPPSESTRCVLRATAIRQRDEWVRVTGRARLTVQDRLRDLHVGDEIELAGRLETPEPAVNPGGFDYAAYLRDQGIQAVVTVEKTSDAVQLRKEGWRWSP